MYSFKTVMGLALMISGKGSTKESGLLSWLMEGQQGGKEEA